MGGKARGLDRKQRVVHLGRLSKIVKSYKLSMAPPKGSKAYWNPDTGLGRRFVDDPGPPWLPGLSPSHRLNLKGHNGTRGQMVFYNPETGRHSKFYVDPGHPWTRGHSSKARKNLSETRISKKIRHSLETIEILRQKTTGHKFNWREGVSRACALRSGCDSIYLLRMSKENQVLGKWGATTRESFFYREKDFARHGFIWEVLLMVETGAATANEEAEMGRLLSRYPAENRPNFFGKTETFEWCESTIAIVQDIITKFHS